MSLKSHLEGIVWPGMPDNGGAQMLSLQQQFEKSELLSAADFNQSQKQQLHGLVQHALATVPWYQERFGQLGLDSGVVDDAIAWSSIPVLSDADIQSAGDALFSTAVPAAHGQVKTGQARSAEGNLLTVQSTAVTRTLWLALSLREHLWHQRNPSLRLAVLRPKSNPKQAQCEALDDWGPPVSTVFDTGRTTVFDAEAPAKKQAEWLKKQNPGYLVASAEHIGALAQYCLQQKQAAEKLHQVRCISGNPDSDLRILCESAWGAKLVRSLSPPAIGHIAFQCPDSNRLHLNSEVFYCEVVDHDGQPCNPGDSGRLLLTTLHNFAQPLIRYAVMDNVRLSTRCECPRHLPLIQL